MILARKSHNCAGTALVQGDSAGGSKLVEQTLYRNSKEQPHAGFSETKFGAKYLKTYATKYAP